MKIALISILLILSSCGEQSTNRVVSGNKQQEIEAEKTGLEKISSHYSADDLVGIWNVFYVEITKYRYSESESNQVLFKTNYAEDSLVIEFKKDFTFSINRNNAGNWSFKNDSVKIVNHDSRTFPLNIDATYRIHKGYFGKNWYLYTNFYNGIGEVSHSVRIVAKRDTI